MDDLSKARAAAARYLGDRGYVDEAKAIRDGAGDDFAEVRIAAQIIAQLDARSQRIEQALNTYAAPDFWDDIGGTSEAGTDAGSLARHSLSGTTPPGRYQD